MPTFSADVLPDAAGRNLGSSSQPWNVFAQNIVVTNTITTAVLLSVPYALTPTFDTTKASVFKMTLTGDVTSSTITGVPITGQVQLLAFEFIQDATGGHALSWPAQMRNASSLAPAANSVTTQLFFWDGTNAWALAPAMVYP